jgi:DNA modification methylase
MSTEIRIQTPELLCGDMIDALADYPDNFFDAQVTDPPYGIGFMGREWDTFKPGTGASRKLLHPRERVAEALVSENPNLHGRHRSPAISPSQIEYDMTVTGLRRFQREVAYWGEAMIRVLKPGGYLLMCGAPRSYHRMACGLEDAGFEIRDCLTWLYGQGFPKSLNFEGGLGTALKPGWEPIVLARKPFAGTVRGVYDEWGTGVLYIDAARLPNGRSREQKAAISTKPAALDAGRWPANVLLDEDAALDLDAAVGILTNGGESPASPSPSQWGEGGARAGGQTKYAGDRGGPSRYFYCAKPSRRERDLGCDHLALVSAGAMTGGRKEGSAGLNSPRAGAGRLSGAKNAHPTVKPIALMRYLIRLVTPPGGWVLDPFMGSGTTLCAALLEGRMATGVEREPDYLSIAMARTEAWERIARTGGEA